MRRVTETVAILFLVVVGDMPPLLAVDYVTAVITCPLTANQKLEWQPTIGSNPTFRNTGPVSRPQQAFHLMERSGQTIKCFYKNGGQYAYTVERSIRSCSETQPNVMACQVRSN